MLTAIGGFLCGLIAGAAARGGRLCSMGAIEDAVVARDYRAAKAWGLALAIAIAATQGPALLGYVDMAESAHATSSLDWITALGGGVLFGFGMALAGTCSFGLLVRLGGGDLRTLVTAAVVGIAAFAITAGPLEPLRGWVSGHLVAQLPHPGGALLPTAVGSLGGSAAAWLVVAALVVVLAWPALNDRGLRKRRRMLWAAVVIGLAVAAGWVVTAAAIERLEPARLESLSFVAPVGRLLLLAMGEPTQFASFGVASVVGVVAGALGVAVLRDEVRWEAFDDAREMRRHLTGAVLMGIGGVLARGCTIGQGMTAGSALALSAPLTVLGVVLGARFGLVLLLEGRAHWHVSDQR